MHRNQISYVLCKPNRSYTVFKNSKLQKNAMILCDLKIFCILTQWILYANQISRSSVGQFSRKMQWLLEISIALPPRNLKFFLYINPYGYSMQTKFHVPRSHSFWENCDDFLKLASHFSPILCNRGTWNCFCILTHMDTLCKPNFMFRGRTVFEKNAMITCKNSKLHNCPNKQLWNFTC